MGQQRAWQDEPLTDAAIQRILDAANLPIEARGRNGNAARVRSSLRKLANRDVHQAFDVELDVRTLNPIVTWISDGGGASDRRLGRALRNARGKGFFAPPPLSERDGALRRWTEQELRQAKGRGRPSSLGNRARLERLLVCFWISFAPEPRYARHLSRTTKQAAASFASAYFAEVAAVLRSGIVTDPENRGRAPNWKRPAHSTLARQFGELDREIWTSGTILGCGEIVWPTLRALNQPRPTNC